MGPLRRRRQLYVQIHISHDVIMFIGSRWPRTALELKWPVEVIP